MSYYFTPPYFLVFAGLFISLTSGSAFAATLKQIVAKWSSDRAHEKAVAKLPTGQLIIPYLGINAGILMFLAAGLEVFGFPGWLAYAAAVPLTLFIAILVWYQLGSMLSYVEQKGFESLDLDSWQ